MLGKRRKKVEEVKFKEVMERQIQEKTKDTVIKVIKEKEGLVRDTVDRKKSIIIFGMKEKKSPVKYERKGGKRVSK